MTKRKIYKIKMNKLRKIIKKLIAKYKQKIRLYKKIFK